MLYYLLTWNLQKIEGQQFTLRAQKNSQDSVKITDQAAVDELAKALKASIQETRPDTDAVKAAVAQNEVVPGAEVRRVRT